MATLLTKRSNTSGSVPLAAQLTNSTGGAELAVNTADKRLYVKDSGGTVVELGISPGSMPTYASGTANGVTYLNGSKVLTSGSALTFDGTTLANINSDGTGFSTQSAASNFSILRLGTDSVNGYAFFQSGKSGTGTTLPFAWRQDSSELMRLTSTGLGIGTSSPARKLDVVDNGNINATSAISNSTAGTSSLARFLAVSDAGSAIFGMTSSSYTDISGAQDAMLLNANSASGGVAFALDGVLRMKLDSSGNLGIGTSSPGYKLDARLSGTSSGAVIQVGNTGSGGFGGLGVSDGGAYPVQMWGSALSFLTGSSVYGSATEKMRLDTSGNLGLGVTPSAWASNFKANQIGQGAYIAGRTDAVALYMGSNGFWNGSSDRYIANGFATDYYQATGQHIWRTAASGTAGNAITFTQAMTLDANANLGVGVTSMAVPSTSRRGLQVSNGTSGGMILLSNSTTESDNPRIFGSVTTQYDLGFSAGGSTGFINWYTNGSERARIDSSGNLLVGATSGIASERLFVSGSNANYIERVYNSNASPYGIIMSYTGAAPNGTVNEFFRCDDTGAVRMSVRSNGGIANYQANDVNLSDRREKTNFAPAKSYLETICAIPVQTFNYIDQAEDDPGLTLGVVAQDVQAVAPELVMESNWGTEEEPKMRLSIYQTDLQYALMKALQELKAEFDAYKASHP